MRQFVERGSVGHFVNQVVGHLGIIPSHGAEGQVVHPGLLLQLDHGRHRFGKGFTGGNRAVPLEQYCGASAQLVGQLHPFGVALDGFHVGIDRQRVPHQFNTFLTHGPQG